MPSSLRRLSLLGDGVVEIAEDLDGEAATLIDRDPLLTSVDRGTSETGASAAVRGLRGAPSVQPLSEVWLTFLR